MNSGTASSFESIFYRRTSFDKIVVAAVEFHSHLIENLILSSVVVQKVIHLIKIQ